MLGRALMTRYLAEAESRGANSVYLLTTRDSSAEAFYTRLNFRRTRQQIMLVRP
ncbi:GNAT family N-acetyltransferase [Deinococcus sp. AJ005]|uniref:GNAT family N-acetyltransferase n=1 Tax=Deinococcus sp. AJ005 TaxID=2652443 RepID=UPI00125CC8F8|nr:GNAT family N-acetyltransferase [Deinococcus sp. AJ005]QFP77934.1 GNAT family N-acetyltransferase [Deinococcus sp. AJ005]